MDKFFTTIATRVSGAVGQPLAFIVALAGIIIWAVTGPLFAFSDTWQLIVNTTTTIITFLMVFIIQNSQNRDAGALQVKLDELLRAVEGARTDFIGIEHMSDSEICRVRDALEKDVDSDRDKVMADRGSVGQLLKRR